ncbi:MAG: 5-(carboxyamino)imidazole ribonucleotide synthase [Wenzhouxiangella sp.]
MRVGILGGGQLARMMAAAGIPLGLDFVFLDPAEDACARRYGELLVANWEEAPDRADFKSCERVTCDFENVPADVLVRLASQTTVRPGPEAFASAQDRLVEKTLFEQLGIPVPPFATVSTRPQLLSAIERIGLPAVLKTRRLGYDGKGQAVLRTMEDLEPAWAGLGGRDLILEGWVRYSHECAITAVRSAAGELVFYPLSWTVHDQGILKLASAPAPVDESVSDSARTMVRRLMEQLDYVGCLTLELFVTDSGLLANEFAPRVHNSAHWTIEGSVTSQFENHLRAVCDLPLGDTAMRGHALMLNWIGSMPDPNRLLAVPGLRWHDYGKQPRAGRKVGHATLVADDREQLRERVIKLQPLLEPQMASLLMGEMTPAG